MSVREKMEVVLTVQKVNHTHKPKSSKYLCAKHLFIHILITFFSCENQFFAFLFTPIFV